MHISLIIFHRWNVHVNGWENKKARNEKIKGLLIVGLYR